MSKKGYCPDYEFGRQLRQRRRRAVTDFHNSLCDKNTAAILWEITAVFIFYLVVFLFIKWPEDSFFYVSCIYQNKKIFLFSYKWFNSKLRIISSKYFLLYDDSISFLDIWYSTFLFYKSSSSYTFDSYTSFRTFSKMFLYTFLKNLWIMW